MRERTVSSNLFPAMGIHLFGPETFGSTQPGERALLGKAILNQKADTEKLRKACRTKKLAILCCRIRDTIFGKRSSLNISILFGYISK